MSKTLARRRAHSQRLAVLIGALLSCMGCEASFPTPFTAAQMRSAGSSEALAHYLSQPGATVAVCDPTSIGPHLGPQSAADFDALADGLLDATIPPEVWQRCATTLLASQTPAASASLLDAIARAYRTRVRSSNIEKDVSEQAQLAALHHVLLLRPAGTAPHATAVAGALDELHQALARGRLGPVATQYGQDLLATLEIERGEWQGAPITAATLDALQARKDEGLLRRFAVRLSDPALRLAAQHRIVRLHIAASPWPEVREHPADVEAAVLARGRNAIDLTEHPPLRGALDVNGLAVRRVAVRQDLTAQTATLLAYGGDRPGVSVVPPLGLRGPLQIDLKGLSRSVSLCAPPAELDVTPCVLPSDVRLNNAIAYGDTDGDFHLAEHTSLRAALALVRDQPTFSLPIEVRGLTLVTLQLPVYFEKPAGLVFTGARGARGPNLGVSIEQRAAGRVVFHVNDGTRVLAGAVEMADARAFAIVSRGGDGADGASGIDGTDGMSGTSGSSASCPSSNGADGSDGGNGEDGGNGGSGSDGGNGGDIRVEASCSASDCAGFASLVPVIVESRGGRGGTGGAGGRGGRGGSGGSGGSGTSCSDNDGHSFSLSRGNSGHSGMDGHDGGQGSSGADGTPGHVQVRLM
jgi:hypothetical protein